MPWPSLTAPMPSGLCLAFASLHNADALPVRTMPLHRGPFRCHAPLRCRLCPAAAPQLNALPMRCDSLRNLAPATPRNAPALPRHSWPKRSCAYRCPCSAQHCPRGSVPIIADAVPIDAPPPHCQASPMHRTALLCHRGAPNAAQFLAHALQVQATQRLCQAWQSLLCPRFATRTSHCRSFAAHMLALPPPY